MEPASKTRREKFEEKERAILSAARAVFIEEGFDGARMADIAKRAGIAEGTVYLYYKNKTLLMAEVLRVYWEHLTGGARAAVDPSADTFDQFRALAAFHLTGMIEDFDFMNLTIVLRGTNAETRTTKDQVKSYVSVFDDIFRQGIDRGVLLDTSPLWMARDCFYGSLEYSCRTLLMRKSPHLSRAVIDNLVETLQARFGVSPSQESPSRSSDEKLLDRLEAAVQKVEAMTRR